MIENVNWKKWDRCCETILLLKWETTFSKSASLWASDKLILALPIVVDSAMPSLLGRVQGMLKWVKWFMSILQIVCCIRKKFFAKCIFAGCINLSTLTMYHCSITYFGLARCKLFLEQVTLGLKLKCIGLWHMMLRCYELQIKMYSL